MFEPVLANGPAEGWQAVLGPRMAGNAELLASPEAFGLLAPKTEWRAVWTGTAGLVSTGLGSWKIGGAEKGNAADCAEGTPESAPATGLGPSAGLTKFDSPARLPASVMGDEVTPACKPFGQEAWPADTGGLWTAVSETLYRSDPVCDCLRCCAAARRSRCWAKAAILALIESAIMRQEGNTSRPLSRFDSESLRAQAQYLSYG